MLLALVLLAGCTTPEVRNERLVRFVDELVFGGPFDAHHEQDKRIARWSGDMRVAITGPQFEDHQEEIEALVATMATLTGVEARMATATDDDADVTVTLAEENEFLVNEEFAGCYVELEREESHIERATIYVGMDRAEKFRNCAAHELMHVFGFRFHSGIVRSVMSPAHDEDVLTEWDKLALRVLYDARIDIGAPRELALPLFRQIVFENTVRD
jgi:hypothetical protein